MENADTQHAGWRQHFALGALILAVVAGLWFALAAIGTTFGWWSWQTGLGTMTGNVNAGIGRFFVGAALVASVLALIFALIKAPRKRPFILALAALLMTALVAGRWMGFQLRALSLPPIHQVQTDWADPIRFSDALMKVRTDGGAMNPVEDAPIIPDYVKENWPSFAGMTVAEAQEREEQSPDEGGKDDDVKLYPPINTLVLDVEPRRALAQALALAEANGWEIVTNDAQAGIIEATHTSRWFRFKDDIAIRAKAGASGGSIVDMRSVSRVGLSDLGANAKRVSNFLSDLKRGAKS